MTGFQGSIICPHSHEWYKLLIWIFLIGDAECEVKGSCKNGKCKVANGKASCTCNADHVKDSNEICTMTGKQSRV